MKRVISILFLIILAITGCKDAPNNEKSESDQTDQPSQVGHSSGEISAAHSHTSPQITTFLTFQENNAEEAMKFYISLFDNSEILEIERYGKGGPAKEGTILKATFVLNGKKFICSDSYITHEWTFTPGISNWVDCRDIAELETLFTQLSAGGQVMMPIDNYGFSQKFAFVEDRFGISWQLNFQ